MKKIMLVLGFALLFCNNAHAYVHMDDKAIERAQEYGIMNYQKNLPTFATPWVIYEEKSKSLDEFGEKVYLYTPYYLVAVNARERLLSSQTINVVDGKLIIDAFGDALPVCFVLYVKDVDDLQNELVILLRQRGELLEAYAMEIQDIAVVQTIVVKEEVVPVQLDDDPTDEKIEGVESVEEEENPAAEVKGKEKKKEDKKKKDKDKKKDDTDKKENDADNGTQNSEPIKAEPVYIDKVVPSLHRVQLFVYFDKRQINLSGQATFLVDLKNEPERRFNFSFDAIQ